MKLPQYFIDHINSVHLPEFLETLNFPIAVCDKNKKLIWSNNKFEDNISPENLSILSEGEEINFELKAKLKFYNFENGAINSGYLVTFAEEKELSLSLKEVKNVAHDFNNILSGISNSVEMLRQKLKKMPDLHYLLENIEKGNNRANDLINELLPGKKKKKKNKRKIKINSLLEELSNACKYIFPKDVTISYKAIDILPAILCNPNEIYRSLLNVCVNASEAIEKSGEVKLEADLLSLNIDEAQKYKLEATDYIRIKVKDTGCGIPNKDLKNIFKDSFSTKDKGRESGLGLNIVRELIKKHNGEIFVDSKIGKGSVFTILLPALTEKVVERRDGAKRKIILADDEETIRELLADLLESYNFQILQAKNGNDVLNLINENSDISLLIIDRKMPELSGIECINILNSKGINIPLILASGSPPDEDENIEELNIDMVLSKPYDFDQMYEIIEKLIR